MIVTCQLIVFKYLQIMSLLEKKVVQILQIGGFVFTLKFIKTSGCMRTNLKNLLVLLSFNT